MKPVNRLLTPLSLTAVVITIERVSPTTRIILPPSDFLRLHEVVQMGVITAFSVLVTFLLFRVLSGNFLSLQDERGTILGMVFFLGTYFYATGNGSHEVASYLLNQYCGSGGHGRGICGSLFVDDYYFGNIAYFLGLGLSTLALILLELRRPDETYDRGDLRVTLANGGVLALTFIAYDAFDRVTVGLIATIVYAVVFGLLLLRSNVRYRALPFTLYSAVGFTLAALVAIPIRLVAALS